MADRREGLFWDAVAGKVPPPPASALLGWKATEAGPGRIRVEFQAKEAFYNPAGVVQGGFLAAMLDDTMGPAATTLLAPGEITATLEMKVSFLRPARAGRLIGEGWVVHKGRSIVFMEGSLTAEDGSLIATATTTARIVPFSPNTSER